MDILNYECKVAVSDLDFYENKLLALEPLFQGEDHQVDTYFMVEEGRVKLREGNIENSLLYYDRQNKAGAKSSSIILYKYNGEEGLKSILLKMSKVKKIVDKVRRIYFIDNVKFHFDRVAGLGTFVEIEAIDSKGSIEIEELKKQCEYYIDYLQLRDADFIAASYSDLI